VVKWGIIGASGVAHRRTMPAIKMADNNELHALMVRDLGRAKKLAEEHGASAYYDSVDDLLSDQEVDAVHIATPVYLHCDHVIRAAEHGKHILCEKPMAINTDECKRMIDACHENNVLLEIGFTLRFHPCFREIKQIAGSGELGEIIEARSSLLKSYEIEEGAWRGNPAMSGGGVLMDMGAHAIDMLIYILGDVSKVAMLGNSRIKGWQVEETATVLLQMENGANAIADSSFVVPHTDITLELYGTKGTLLLYNGKGYQEYIMKVYTDELKEEFKPTQNLYKNLVEHFSRCLDGDEDPVAPGIAGLKSTQVISAAYESLASGKIVQLNKETDTIQAFFKKA